jgi:tetratricopeptide (TPR) repeat protein
VALMSCLKPRWGGTYEKMEQLAQSSQMLVRQNPRLAALKGFADAAYAETMNDQDQYALAVQYYTRAIEKGGDYSWFYQGRADALARLDLHDEAIEDLRRADQLWPGDADTLVWLAYNFSAMNRNNEALKEINQAGEIAGLAPFGQRLRTTILSSLRQDDVEKLDFGD